MCFYVCRLCTGENYEALNLKIWYFNERELNWDGVDTVVPFLRQWMVMWNVGKSVIFSYTVQLLSYEYLLANKDAVHLIVWFLYNILPGETLCFVGCDFTFFIHHNPWICFLWISLCGGFTVLRLVYSDIIVFHLQEQKLWAYMLFFLTEILLQN
jgi:hypothetical protein